jgi:glutaminyl-peptide cyclotransferase
MLKHLFNSLLLLFILASCTDEKTPSETSSTVNKLPYAFHSPANNAKLICGDPLPVQLDLVEEESMETVQILFNDSLVYETTTIGSSVKTMIDTKNLPVGYHRIQIRMKDKSGKELIDNRTVILFSDIFPEIYVAKIVNEYPHSTTSYTQGLEFYKGKLYEGTGQTGQSKLLEVDMPTGAIKRSIDVADYIFGEGITVLNDEVYQVTWQARKCFVYDVNTFEKKREYQYFGEGWGLANDGKHIIMSNGTSELVFRDPTTFEKVRSIHVFGSNQEYVALNELEYHDGYLYANVYQEYFVLKIDPKTGKVVAKIDCIELVKQGKGGGDVLNGIAFNEKTKRFVLTGKNWPKLFEVEFVQP